MQQESEKIEIGPEEVAVIPLSEYDLQSLGYDKVKLVLSDIDIDVGFNSVKRKYVNYQNVINQKINQSFFLLRNACSIGQNCIEKSGKEIKGQIFVGTMFGQRGKEEVPICRMYMTVSFDRRTYDVFADFVNGDDKQFQLKGMCQQLAPGQVSLIEIPWFTLVNLETFVQSIQNIQFSF